MPHHLSSGVDVEEDRYATVGQVEHNTAEIDGADSRLTIGKELPAEELANLFSRMQCTAWDEAPVSEPTAPTIVDVADLAGVSYQTVSRVINSTSVKEETRALVIEAIRSLDYRPNPAAQALGRRNALDGR